MCVLECQDEIGERLGQYSEERAIFKSCTHNLKSAEMDSCKNHLCCFSSDKTR